MVCKYTYNSNTLKKNNKKKKKTGGLTRRFPFVIAIGYRVTFIFLTIRSPRYSTL